MLLSCSFAIVLGVSFIYGHGDCTRVNHKCYLSLTPKGPKRDHRPLLWSSSSDADPTFSSGQGGQSPEVQREEENQEIREDNQVCLKESIRGNKAPYQGAVREESRRRNRSGSNVLHDNNYRKWLWNRPIILSFSTGKMPRRGGKRRQKRSSDQKEFYSYFPEFSYEYYCIWC